MSSLMYGALTQRRVTAPEDEPLQVGMQIAEAVQDDENAVTDGTGGEPRAPSSIVGHIADVLVALVPAEVLALHAVAMSFGTMTTGSGENAITVITRPVEMRVVFGVLM